MSSSPRHPLVYVLHSGKLFGTERMTLATLAGLADEFQPILVAPPGPALAEAEKLGIDGRPFAGKKQLSKTIRSLLKANRRLTFVATGVVQSAFCLMWNFIYRRQINHIHVVHGGTDESGSYAKKKWLNQTGAQFVAVSEFVRQRLIANGVRADRIEVVSNFLPEQQIAAAPRRAAFDAPGVKNVLIVSRLEPLKRVDLLLDALDRAGGSLAGMSFKVLGLGRDMAALQARAAGKHPSVAFVGFSEDVAGELARADLLLHTCPVEPFGLVILEAMAANVPVLAPDSGGAGALIEEGVSGFRFRSDDAGHLAERLKELSQARAETLNRAVAGGRKAVEETYSAKAALEKYRQIFRVVREQ